MFFKTKIRTWQSQKATIQRTAGFSLCDKNLTHGLGEVSFFFFLFLIFFLKEFSSFFCSGGGSAPTGLGGGERFFFFFDFRQGTTPGRFWWKGGFCFTFRSWWWGRRQIIRNPNGGTRARVTLAIGVLLRLRRPRELGRRAPLWTLRRRGSWAIDPAARKRGACERHPALHMLSCPDLPRP